MLNYKHVIATLLVTTSLIAQTILNGYGLGMKNYYHEASTLSLSSSGLIPSFNKNISLSNPSTWHNLNYTYFTGSYVGNYNSINDIENSSTLLGAAKLIIPIKNKYSIGVGIEPYYQQYLELEGGEHNEFILNNDTLDTYLSHTSYGGTSEISFYLGANIIKNLNIAIKYGNLYGSNRQQEIFTLDELDYYTQHRMVYSGSILGLYANSDYLSELNVPITLFAGFSFPIKPISADIAYYQPFEDSNDSGYQDSGDFPSASDAKDPTEVEIDKLSSPYEYQFGFDYQLKNRFSILGEYSGWSDKSEKSADISKFNDQFTSISHINVGIARFAPEIIKSTLDRFNFKLSAFSQNIELLNSEKNIKVYGVSGGVGFNFGRTKNQIDIGYSFGKREGLIGVEEEIIHRYSIGITVGDVWFVKRRAR